MAQLLHPKDMPRIEGVDIPNDLYQILDTPPLAGMRYPRWSPPWSRLKDLIGGGSPQDPEREERLIRETVNIISKKLALGRGVIVHCEGGRGRTGTVLGCVLCALGFSSSEAISYLDSLHQARGKPAPAWPESKWQSELVGRYCD